jgi:gamma-glutamyltranspeptidase
MCSPSILSNTSSVIALGAAGSSRIRSIILQAIYDVQQQLCINQIQKDIKEDIFQKIVERERLHFDSSGLHIEHGYANLSNFKNDYQSTIHPKENLFFGCLNITGKINNSLIYGADPRREAIGYVI